MNPDFNVESDKRIDQLLSRAGVTPIAGPRLARCLLFLSGMLLLIPGCRITSCEPPLVAGCDYQNPTPLPAFDFRANCESKWCQETCTEFIEAAQSKSSNEHRQQATDVLSHPAGIVETTSNPNPLAESESENPIASSRKQIRKAPAAVVNSVSRRQHLTIERLLRPEDRNR